MGTRSMIGILNESGTVTASYCHYDGYFDGVCKTLIESYNNGEKAIQVARGGYLSSLGPNYDESKGFAANEDVADLFNNEVDFKENAEEFCGAEYIYLWDGAQWLVNECYGPGDAFGRYNDEGFQPLEIIFKEVA